jgi:heptosyltransferase-2
MSLPAIRIVRQRLPQAHIAVLARPWVAELYARESAIDEVLPYGPRPGFHDLSDKLSAARSLRGFDAAILLQNAFEAAAVAWLARIPRRIGYDRDGRGWLLTDAVRVPRPGEIPRHERYYYLELLRRAGIIDGLPQVDEVLLEGRHAAALTGARLLRERGITGPVVGVSPGAAYGSAKRWLPERFAHAACDLARERGASIVLFGSSGERVLCEHIASIAGDAPIINLAGKTTLGEFIALAAACRLFLTNDSGAMHIAAALGVPSVTIFGSTDSEATGPIGAAARIVRHPVPCAPCLLRECPIDHRCMTGVALDDVMAACGELWTQTQTSGYQTQDSRA